MPGKLFLVLFQAVIFILNSWKMQKGLKKSLRFLDSLSDFFLRPVYGDATPTNAIQENSVYKLDNVETIKLVIKESHLTVYRHGLLRLIIYCWKSSVNQ